MTRRLLALFAPGLLMLVGCADPPSRYHNHGTPGLGHYTPKPQTFAIDLDKGSDFTVSSEQDGRTILLRRDGKRIELLEADPPAKKPKPRPTSNKDITPDGTGHPEWDPQTGGFPADSNIRFEHNPPSQRNRCAELDLNNPVPPECTEGKKPVWKPRIPRPKNGECPVCGTMAPQFHTATCPEGEMCLVTQDMNISASRRIDCAHCSTTFRQWAEGREPKR